MARRFTRAQSLQNRAFLDALARTGNARLAARELGVHRATYTKRRARCAAFAQDWDAALAAAHARFKLSGGSRPPEACPERSRRSGERSPEPPRPARSSRAKSRGAGTSAATGIRASDRNEQPLRTRGGEPVVIRQKNGRLQLRLAPTGRMTQTAEQTFLRALAASANIRLAAAAAGFAHSSFYARKRKAGAFAREMRLALAEGYERLELAALAAADPECHDAWRRAEPHPLPAMTADQMLQLLSLHQNSVRQGWDQPHRRKRRGESWDIYTERLRAMYRAEQHQQRDAAALRRAARYEETGDWRLPEEPPLPELPPLDLVAGWSKADPTKPKHNPKKAMFGGWRIDDVKRRRR
jgi:hypothetical protein